jgi:hypothetical protein
LGATTAGSSRTTNLEAQHDLTGLFVAKLVLPPLLSILYVLTSDLPRLSLASLKRRPTTSSARRSLSTSLSSAASFRSRSSARRTLGRLHRARRRETFGGGFGTRSVCISRSSTRQRLTIERVFVLPQFPEEATNALEQAQGIRVLGRTLRVERAKAHRMLLVEPREGVSFERSPTSGSWLIRTGEQQMVDSPYSFALFLQEAAAQPCLVVVSVPLGPSGDGWRAWRRADGGATEGWRRLDQDLGESTALPS